jgi:hypothetical protein
VTLCNEFTDQVQGVRAHQRVAYVRAGAPQHSRYSLSNTRPFNPLTRAARPRCCKGWSRSNSLQTTNLSVTRPSHGLPARLLLPNPPLSQLRRRRAAALQTWRPRQFTEAAVPTAATAAAPPPFSNHRISLPCSRYFTSLHPSTIFNPLLTPPPPPCSSATMNPKPSPPSPPVPLTAAPAPCRPPPPPPPALEPSTPPPHPCRTRFKRTSTACGAAASSVPPPTKPQPQPQPLCTSATPHRARNTCHGIKTLNP